MKNFKFNAITALVVGVNVAAAHAADGTPSPVPNHDTSTLFGHCKIQNIMQTRLTLIGPGHTAIGQQAT